MMLTSDTPVLDSFLRSTAELVNNRNAVKLQDFLQIEPPLPEIYLQMVVELKSHYSRSASSNTELLERCDALVPRTRGAPWPAFSFFMSLYFSFLRDVNVDNLLETYNLLKGLVK
jgi:nuclear mRNA export protein PCID2/THP1